MKQDVSNILFLSCSFRKINGLLFFLFLVCPLNYIYFLLELICFVSSLNMHIKHTTRGRYYAYFKKAFLYGALWEV